MLNLNLCLQLNLKYSIVDWMVWRQRWELLLRFRSYSLCCLAFELVEAVLLNFVDFDCCSLLGFLDDLKMGKLKSWFKVMFLNFSQKVKKKAVTTETEIRVNFRKFK